jgi:hypothetical protein
LLPLFLDYSPPCVLPVKLQCAWLTRQCSLHARPVAPVSALMRLPHLYCA